MFPSSAKGKVTEMGLISKGSTGLGDGLEGPRTTSCLASLALPLRPWVQRFPALRF